MGNMATVLVKGIMTVTLPLTWLTEWLTDYAQWPEWPHMYTQPKFQLTMYIYFENQVSKHNMGAKASKILIFHFFHHSFFTMTLEFCFYGCCHRAAFGTKGMTHLCFWVVRGWIFRKDGLQIQKLSVYI